jgi:hypothetical protein
VRLHARFDHVEGECAQPAENPRYTAREEEWCPRTRSRGRIIVRARERVCYFV